MTGIPTEVSVPVSASPMPDSTSTLPKTPPAPVTKMMIATIGSAESATWPIRVFPQPAMRPTTR